MRTITDIFLRRPVLAVVVNLVIVIAGLQAIFTLTVRQYPRSDNAAITVTTVYVGASPELVRGFVTTPLERAIAAADGIDYIESVSRQGVSTIAVRLKLNYDPNKALAEISSRVNQVRGDLPPGAEIPVINIENAESSIAAAYLSFTSDILEANQITDYLVRVVQPRLSAIEGVQRADILGGRTFAMRIWLKPDRLAAYGLGPEDVRRALQANNFLAAVGRTKGALVQVDLTANTDLQSAEEFRNLVIQRNGDRLVRLRDVADVVLGAEDYDSEVRMSGRRAVFMGVWVLPTANTLDVIRRVRAEVEAIRKDLPTGLEAAIAYDATQYIENAIREVLRTLSETLLIVAVVIYLFLGSLRSVLVPLVAIPVSLIGAVFLMQLFGFSLNLLTLLAIVLSVGLVVDDAIVVVENVERHLAEGKTPIEATRQAMDEISGAVVAIALVLSSVFLPTAFLPGIQGKFYQQFALTISVSTLISAFVALTLSPALCALLLRPHGEKHDLISRLIHGTVGRLFQGFNRGFEACRSGYLRALRLVIRHGALVMLLYAAMLGLTALGFVTVPTGFIPVQDKGTLFCYLQLPDGASLNRTAEVSTRVYEMIRETPGVETVLKLDGFSILSFGSQPNASTLIVRLEPFEKRRKTGLTSTRVLGMLQPKFASVTEGVVVGFNLPPVDGLGSIGGFKLQLQDRANLGPQVLQTAAFSLMAAANQDPRLQNVITTYRGSVPQVMMEVDREKAKRMQVPLSGVWEALSVYLGGLYVNDFNLFGRPFQVVAQADAPFRAQPRDALDLRTRNAAGEMVPLGTLVRIRDVTGPTTVYHYNLYPSADLSGVPAPGVSSGQAVRILEGLARQLLPPGMGFEWTELTLLEQQAGRTGVWIFLLCVIMVFLVLAAQYESWLLPLAIILITPMSLLFAVLGLWARGMDNNLFAQIGFVVLIGLACKNAVLVVEFARQLQVQGRDRFAAVLEAARLRLRPILMTSLAFTVGVLPLMIATGAGSELRRAIGTATFWGMLGVTAFGVFLTPVFYVVLRRLAGERSRPGPDTRTSGTVSGAAAGAPLLALALLGSLGLTGCTVGPDYVQPGTPVPAAFVHADAEIFSSETPDVRWWRQFQDPLLEALIGQALAANHDLRIASARLEQARALRHLQALDVTPGIQARGGFTRTAYPAQGFSGIPRDAREAQWFETGFDATWELDLFGRVRRSIEAARAEEQTAAARRRAVLISLMAEVARNYCELRGLQYQLAVARTNAQVQEETLRIVEAKLRGGRATELDVARARAQYESTLALIPSLESAIQQTIHRLGVLSGREPAALAPQLEPARPLPRLPERIPVGNPADLLRRRPDVQEAERALAAATARIGVATADLFPRVTLLGTLGWQADTLSRLGGAGSDAWSFGPRIQWAALDLVRVRDRIAAARANADAELANYEKTVLLALEDAENALVNLGRIRVETAHLHSAVASARRAAELAEERYKAGVAEYLTVLDANRTLLELERQLALAETRLLTAHVAVYKALGGGWEIERQPGGFAGPRAGQSDVPPSWSGTGAKSVAGH